MGVAKTELGGSVQTVATSVKKSALSAVAARATDDIRTRVLMENPELIERVTSGGGFGGEFSRHIGQHIFGKHHQPAIDDALKMTTISAVGERQWLIQMPIVNAVLFDTDDGLVVVDAGMAPAGPALLAAIRSVSDKPIHTIIITHGHTDHAYGTYALVEDSPNAVVIGQQNIIPRFERYIKLRGSLAHYMSQPVAELPASETDLVWPTQTFDQRLELTIGGELFVLQHHRGETDDQLYVWLPGRKALASADYYQGFLPNVGNGKRVQRYVEDWAVAMREMAGLKPQVLLPSHGAAMTDAAEIEENFIVLAEVLETITEQTFDGLNKGLRKDQIVNSIELPARLANHSTMNTQYVSAKDIAKMLLKQYTGWWDDIPSNWSPAAKEAQGAEIVALAGGIDKLVAHTRAVLASDVVMASHLADWAWLAEPGDSAVQQLVIDVYRARVIEPATNTQEMLTYIDQMAQARSAQLAAQ
jgi:alkyl sulfatase BDS1-like metallo-beta-lactamase superfamily hydrolase